MVQRRRFNGDRPGDWDDDAAADASVLSIFSKGAVERSVAGMASYTHENDRLPNAWIYPSLVLVRSSVSRSVLGADAGPRAMYGPGVSATRPIRARFLAAAAAAAAAANLYSTPLHLTTTAPSVPCLILLLQLAAAPAAG
jgi:hypothetical protein